MKNMLVCWEGGGYDGCFWEPNTGYFDNEEQWHPIISTGYKGRDTIEEFRAKADVDEDNIFPITEEGLLDFQKIIRDDFCIDTLRALEEAGYAVVWKCSECGGTIHGTEDFAQFGGYHGDGGIGIIQENPICWDCFNRWSCPSCNQYVGEAELEEHYGVCDPCLDALKRVNEEIEELEDLIGKTRADTKAISELNTKMKEVYERQCSERVAELTREIIGLVKREVKLTCHTTR